MSTYSPPRKKRDNLRITLMMYSITRKVGFLAKENKENVNTIITTAKKDE